MIMNSKKNYHYFFSIFLEIMFRSRCHRPQRKSDSIEYHISSTQISFLLTPATKESATSTSTTSAQTSHPTLFTFPANATLNLISAQENFIKLAAKHISDSATTTDVTAAYFELEGKTLDENLQFSSILSPKLLVLVINDNIRSKFHRTKRLLPNSVALIEHRKGLLHRLPTANGNRPKSDQKHIYPNESLDLLFDTLHGELAYLTEYLKSHFGERHKFTTYPIQQQKQSEGKQWNEWERGIYKMRGDKDGTVIIALASDW
jgi:hypothetical protein